MTTGNGTPDDASTSQRFERDGLVVMVSARSGGTSITATLPVEPAGVLLEVTAQTDVTVQAVGDGESVDVTVADPDFDAKFHVEGAPADVVRALLDESLRGVLLANHPCRLALEVDQVSFSADRQLSTAALEAATDAVVRLATALPSAANDAELARGRPSTGGLYRSPADAAAIERRHTRSRIELDRLESMRSIGSFLIPAAMATCAVGHVALAFTYLSLMYALLSLLLLPVSALIGGLVLYIAVGVIADLAGIAGVLRHRRKRRFDALAAAAADPPEP